MNNNEFIKNLQHEMLTQSNRSTSYPIFIVVEEKKIYGVDENFSDGRDRKDSDAIDYKNELCDECKKASEDGELPDDCDNWRCSDSFMNYKIEEDVPNIRAGFFFSAKACDQHIENNRHHYNHTAHSYAISACYNHELQGVMEFIKNIE